MYSVVYNRKKAKETSKQTTNGPFPFQNGGPTRVAANNLPLRGSKATLWEGGTKGAAFVYSETLLKKTKYVNTE